MTGPPPPPDYQLFAICLYSLLIPDHRKVWLKLDENRGSSSLLKIYRWPKLNSKNQTRKIDRIYFSMYTSTQSTCFSYCNVHTIVFLLSQTAVNYHLRLCTCTTHIQYIALKSPKFSSVAVYDQPLSRYSTFHDFLIDAHVKISKCHENFYFSTDRQKCCILYSV